MANTNRTKGHNGERIYCNLFKDMGYTFCKTSRQASRLLDDAGIDLAFIPYNVQLKTGFHKALNPIALLKNMREKIVEFFPPEDVVHFNPCIVIHRNQIGPGKKRVPNDDLVFMKPTTFRDLYTLNNPYSYISNEKGGSKRGWTYRTALEELSGSSIKVLIHTIKKEKIYVLSFVDFKKLINK